MAGGLDVHEADVSARLVIQIILVVPATLLDSLANCLEDRIVQLTPVPFVQVVYRMPGMQARSEKDVLGDGISQTRNKLILREQPFDAPFFSFQE